MDNYNKLDTIYLVEDPWRMTSPWEKHRFAETNRIILDNFGKVRSLLEIGCGEGHQSLQLSRVCDHLIGLDVSTRAVERARKKCPEEKFLIGDIYSDNVNELAPFDLVVACEVIYYMSDVETSLNRIREIGRNGLVSYYGKHFGKLDPLVLSIPGATSEIIEFNQARWRIACWK
jgi:SAM-dependent methyltransferase